MVIPSINGVAVTNISSNSVTIGGEITSEGGSTVTARGVCWATYPLPTTSDFKTTNGTGPGRFTSAITGLNPGITYFARAYAINEIGTAYGVQVTFSTLALPPVLTTIDLTAINTTTATSGGIISNDGGSAISERGVCWATATKPTKLDFKTSDGSGSGSFISNMTGLITGTTYYVRAYASNAAGTSYGNEYSFTPGTFTDSEGNIYHYVVIGLQVWMVENLKVTKFRNGDPIANVTDASTWAASTTGAYCWYNNDAALNRDTYGALYNFYAVADSRNIAPTGWHIPTLDEWNALVNFVGGGYFAGGKLKETGTAHWRNPNEGTTNSWGFTALPGGLRNDDDGTFNALGEFGYWWNNTTSGFYSAENQYIGYRSANCNNWDKHKQYGYSVRCIRD